MKQKKSKKLAVGGYGTTALVTGIIGVIVLPPIFSTLAVIFGAVGMSKNQRHAKAGLILGIIGLVWFVISIILIAVAFAAFLGGL